jgi:hypothetical protein
LLLDCPAPTDGSGCLEWRDVGGGLADLTVYPAPTRPGLTAIRLYAESNARRASWWSARRVRVAAYGTGSWGRCLLVDGTNASQHGEAGIRNVSLQDFYAFCATNTAVEIRNGIWLHWWGGGVFQGTGTPDGAKVVITGGPGADQQSEGANLTGLNVTGPIVIDRARRTRFDGGASKVQQTPNAQGVSVNQL